MIKNLKIIAILFSLVIIFSSFSSVCFAELGKGFDESKIADSGGVNPFINQINKVWSSVLLIMQVASAGGVIFMGVRYMFASASEKANLKNSTIYGIIGIVMVFAVSTFIKFVMEATGYIL